MVDFIIRNGRLIDFATGTVGTGDVHVKDGRIVAAGTFAEDAASEIFDASGKYVVPGLIDAHVHLHFDGGIGAHADVLCPPNGVTTAVDGGSAGWQNYALFAKANALRYMTTVKGFVHLSPFGVLEAPRTETHDPETFDEDAVLRVFDAFPDSVLGVKIRMDARTLEGFGTAPLKKAVAIADRVNECGRRCVVDAHCANLPDDVDLAEVLDLLRPGDILVHAFQNRGQTLFDANGKVLPCARRARDRGVFFDCATGRIHWSFANFRKALADGFPPDIISSDVIRESCHVRPGYSVLHAMCAMLASGMEEIDVLAAVTRNPARILGIDDEAGSLDIGRRADIAVLDVIEKQVPLFDRFGGRVTTERVFLPLMTMKAGEIVFRQIFF